MLTEIRRADVVSIEVGIAYLLFFEIVLKKKKSNCGSVEPYHEHHVVVTFNLRSQNVTDERLSRSSSAQNKETRAFATSWTARRVASRVLSPLWQYWV